MRAQVTEIHTCSLPVALFNCGGGNNDGNSLVSLGRGVVGESHNKLSGPHLKHDSSSLGLLSIINFPVPNLFNSFHFACSHHLSYPFYPMSLFSLFIFINISFHFAHTCILQ